MPGPAEANAHSGTASHRSLLFLKRTSYKYRVRSPIQGLHAWAVSCPATTIRSRPTNAFPVDVPMPGRLAADDRSRRRSRSATRRTPNWYAPCSHLQRLQYAAHDDFSPLSPGSSSPLAVQGRLRQDRFEPDHASVSVEVRCRHFRQPVDSPGQTGRGSEPAPGSPSTTGCAGHGLPPELQ